jgi:hypothetical protein
MPPIPWPMSPREMIEDKKFYKNYPKKGMYTIFTRCLNYHKDVPEVKKNLRVTQPFEVTVFEDLGDSVRITVSSNCDFKGSIPKALITEGLKGDNKKFWNGVVKTALPILKKKRAQNAKFTLPW